jgi:hypothetical protein
MEKYEKYLQELENDFKNKIQNNPTSVTISDKTMGITKKIDQIVQSKCPEQLARVKDLCSFSTNNGQLEIKYQPSKEQEANEALKRLDQCQGQLSNYYLAIESIAGIAITTINAQLDSCVRDCVSTNNNNEAKSCIRNCFDYTYKYTFNTFQKLTLNQIEMVENELKKII